MTHVFKSAFITGGASGLGRALALQLARRGCSVAIGDIDVKGAEETAEAARALGVSAFAGALDVREPDAFQDFWDAAESALGPLDLMVNNAGVAVSGAVGDVPLTDWTWVIDINLRGVVHGCEIAARAFRARGRGVVLNVSSAAGLIGVPGLAPYCATKAAVVALSEVMHAELRPVGVGVTVLCPTFFQTNLLDTARSSDTGSVKVAAKLMARASMDADDVARAALDAAARGRLHAVPMTDGKMVWRIARLFPGPFYRHGTRLQAVIQRLGRQR